MQDTHGPSQKLVYGDEGRGVPRHKEVDATVKEYGIARRTVVLPLVVGEGVGGSFSCQGQRGRLRPNRCPTLRQRRRAQRTLSSCTSYPARGRRLGRLPSLQRCRPQAITSPCRNDDGPNRVRHSTASIPPRPPASSVLFADALGQLPFSGSSLPLSRRCRPSPRLTGKNPPRARRQRIRAIP